jgi:glycosyltransferase involved in cell wall biosynthesis
VNNPLITVLMPVFNAEKYLSEAIDSILDQSFDNFEFIIIDDASTDSSVQIINSYTDVRIRFIQNQTNLGISATLNKGIEMASAELIARMDADDISHVERLQKQYGFFIANPGYALLSSRVQVILPDKTPVRVDHFKNRYYYYNLNFICWIYHSSVMYKRSAVIDVGKYSQFYSEDFDLWWKISRKYKIHHMQEVLLDYRITAESLSHVVKKEEYEIAQHKQVLRNIHYYTGKDYHLTYSEIECYRHNFKPLLNENTTTAVLKCIKKLKHISKSILYKDNINLDKKAVEEAFEYKKEFMISFYAEHFKGIKRFIFYIQTGYFLTFFIRIRDALLRRIFKVSLLDDEIESS